MSNTIVIIEDEEDISALITMSLASLVDFRCVSGVSGEEAIALFKEHDPALLILDLQLPDIDGFSVCSRIRTHNKHTPIIIVTARNTEKDTVLGYDLGANDYITKPFSPAILLAKVKTLLKERNNTITHSLDKSSTASTIAFESVVLDTTRKIMKYTDKKGQVAEVFLSTTEWDIMKFFMMHPEEVFSRDEIIDAVRGTNYPIMPRVVDVHIFSLRQKLAGAAVVLQTIRGVGYKLSKR